MTLELKLFQNGDAKQGASVALHANLFVSTVGWELYERLKSVATGRFDGYVAVAYEDELPVAVVLVRIGWTRTKDIAAYCVSHKRRQGITTKLIDKLKEAEVELPVARTGAEGSHEFWHKNSVPCVVPEYA